MSELNQVIRLVRIASQREAAGDFDAAEAAWEAARRANAEIPHNGSPLFEIRSSRPVASPQLDDLAPGWFALEDEISPADPRLNVSNHLPGKIGEYRPPSAGERVSGLLAGAFGSAAETACQPEITAGNLVAGVVSGFLSGLLNDPQIEISSPRLPSSVLPEEALALGYIV